MGLECSRQEKPDGCEQGGNVANKNAEMGLQEHKNNKTKKPREDGELETMAVRFNSTCALFWEYIHVMKEQRSQTCSQNPSVRMSCIETCQNKLASTILFLRMWTSVSCIRSLRLHQSTLTLS